MTSPVTYIGETAWVHRTFQERGYCTRAGYQRLDQVPGGLCSLGNAWRTSQPRITCQDRCRSLSLVRADDPEGIGHAFFRRCKRREPPGYPRFRRCKRYTTIVDRVR